MAIQYIGYILCIMLRCTEAEQKEVRKNVKRKRRESAAARRQPSIKSRTVRAYPGGTIRAAQARGWLPKEQSCPIPSCLSSSTLVVLKTYCSRYYDYG